MATASRRNMTSKLLQVIGVITVLGLVAGSIAGFGILKDRVRVVVEADDADLGPDPTALLRDDVQSLAGNLLVLQQAVASNFEQLASGLEAGAEARHEDVRQLLQTVKQVQSRLDALGLSMARVQAKVDALQIAPATAAVSEAQRPVAVEQQPSPVVAPAEEEPPAEEPPAEESPAEESPAEESPAEKAPAEKATKKRGFLSFSLPSTRLAFDEPQTYSLLSKLCRVGFDAKSTLHDFTGVTSAVTGSFRADFDDREGLCKGTVVVAVGTLKTGVEDRDTNMWEYLDQKNHPEIRFAIERFEAAEAGVDVAAGKATGEVFGKMTIRGKTLDLRMPVKIEVDPQQRVVITGQQKLKLSDYGVPVPSQLGVINMEDEVVVWIALRARAQAEAGK